MWINCYKCYYYDELPIYCRLKKKYMGERSNNRMCKNEKFVFRIDFKNKQNQ